MSVILLYILDSLRADATEPYKTANNTTPELKKLANDGVVFYNAYSQSTWTRPSGASILSSTYPSLHDVNTVDDSYPRGLPSVAEELQRAGYTTVGITAMGNISPAFGFDKGFDDFRTLYDREKIIDRNIATESTDTGWNNMFDSDKVGIATGADINKEVKDVLESYSDDIFIFIWSLDTHDPYYHRDPSISRHIDVIEDEPIWNHELEKMNTEKGREKLWNLYRDMVYYADNQIGDLVRLLQSKGVYEDSSLIITGDHGEAFGEHGSLGHRGKPYEEQIHVPLIIKPGGASNSASGYMGPEKIVELIDIYPTICELADINPGSQFIQGDDLFRDTEKNRAFTEVLGTREGYRAFRTKNIKYIQVLKPKMKWSGIKGTAGRFLAWLKTIAASDEVYDMASDIDELENIIKKTDINAIKNNVREQVNENIERSTNIENTEESIIHDETKTQLEHLGYLK